MNKNKKNEIIISSYSYDQLYVIIKIYRIPGIFCALFAYTSDFYRSQALGFIKLMEFERLK